MLAEETAVSGAGEEDEVEVEEEDDVEPAAPGGEGNQGPPKEAMVAPNPSYTPLPKPSLPRPPPSLLSPSPSKKGRP